MPRGPDVASQRSIAMRYLGQWRSLAVAGRRRAGRLDDAVARFHAEHEREFSYRRDGAPVELYQLAAAGGRHDAEARAAAPRARADAAMPEPVDAPAGVLRRGGDAVDTPVYERDDAAGRARASTGPAVDRAARLDHARAARRRPPRSTSG